MSTRIKILEDIIARQIAAGEVIDRPAAVLRELLDNSIDSGATHIEVLIKNTGFDLIQVSDDGTGMTKDDIPISCLPHATSKIVCSEDLSNITTMGFRGEALSSIAAVSKVHIISKHEASPQAWSIEAHNTFVSAPLQAARSTGTTVKSALLFHDIPARRNFLSSPQAELNHLKNVFFKKAAAFPDIVFNFQSESPSKSQSNTLANTSAITLPKESLLARSIRICSNNITTDDFLFIDAVHLTQGQSIQGPIQGQDSFSLSASVGLPHIAQKTRKHIHIYINNRPVKAFNIVQAVEYSYRNVLHGQKYPQAVIFLSIPPHLLDVNIHPAKSEIKIRSIEPIRKLIISNITQTLQHIASSTPSFTTDTADSHNMNTASMSTASMSTGLLETNPKNNPENKPENHHDRHLKRQLDQQPERQAIPSIFLDNTKQTQKSSVYEQHPPYTHNSTHSNKTNEHDPPQNTVWQSNNILNHLVHPLADEHPTPRAWDYLCTIFNTYLLFESAKNEQARTIILMDFHAAHERILYDALIEKSKPTALLVPIPLSLDTDADTIMHIIEKYNHIGIEIQKHNDEFLLSSIPSQTPIPADDIARLIEEHLDIDTINAKIFASRACRKAAKAGDFVDKEGADTLLQQVLALEHPRCPHGRPLWIQLDKHTLDKMIGRIE